MNTTARNILWIIFVGVIVLIVAIVIFQAYRSGLRDGISWSQSGDD